MLYALAGSGALLAAVFAAAAWGALRFADRVVGRLEAAQSSDLELRGFASREDIEAVERVCNDIAKRLQEVERETEDLPRRWEDIRNEARRFDGRARYALSRAKAFAQESGFDSAQLDALLEEAGMGDVPGGEGQGVQPVHESVAQAGESDDWRATVRRMIRGG